MLINSKLFNYSSPKPWHFKTINTVAEGKSPDVGGIVWCPHFCVVQLCYCSGRPPAGVFTDTRDAPESSSSNICGPWWSFVFLFCISRTRCYKPSQRHYIQKWLSILREKESTVHAYLMVYMHYPDTVSTPCIHPSFCELSFFLSSFFSGLSKGFREPSPLLLTYVWTDLPLSSVLAMRRAALSDWRLRFLSSKSTSRGLEESWSRGQAERKSRWCFFKKPTPFKCSLLQIYEM